MNEILLWPPVLWTARVLLLILLGGGVLTASLYLVRFLRPRNLWALLTAELPAFRRVGGTAKVLGQELTLNAELDERRDLQLQTIARRLEAVETQIEGLDTALGYLLADPEELEDGNG